MISASVATSPPASSSYPSLEYPAAPFTPPPAPAPAPLPAAISGASLPPKATRRDFSVLFARIVSATCFESVSIVASAHSSSTLFSSSPPPSPAAPFSALFAAAARSSSSAILSFLARCSCFFMCITVFSSTISRCGSRALMRFTSDACRFFVSARTAASCARHAAFKSNSNVMNGPSGTFGTTSFRNAFVSLGALVGVVAPVGYSVGGAAAVAQRRVAFRRRCIPSNLAVSRTSLLNSAVRSRSATRRRLSKRNRSSAAVDAFAFGVEPAPAPALAAPPLPSEVVVVVARASSSRAIASRYLPSSSSIASTSAACRSRRYSLSISSASTREVDWSSRAFSSFRRNDASSSDARSSSLFAPAGVSLDANIALRVSICASCASFILFLSRFTTASSSWSCAARSARSFWSPETTRSHWRYLTSNSRARDCALATSRLSSETVIPSEFLIARWSSKLTRIAFHRSRATYTPRSSRARSTSEGRSFAPGADAAGTPLRLRLGT
eukprot:31089-Pelagococcus_subviridis.AAC.11